MTRNRKERLHGALDTFLDESLNPENYDLRTNLRVRRRHWNANPGRPLPAPRYRLMQRLQLLSDVQEWNNGLMKRILADAESLEDAKAHKKLAEKADRI